MAPQKSLFWHLGQKYNFVDRYFFWYGFSIIWAIFMLKQLILSIKLFSQIQKNLFFYDPHHSDKKWRTIDEFLTDFEKIFTFVIRITFLTKYGVPRRIWERDLVQHTPTIEYQIAPKKTIFRGRRRQNTKIYKKWEKTIIFHCKNELNRHTWSQNDHQDQAKMINDHSIPGKYQSTILFTLKKLFY